MKPSDDTSDKTTQTQHAEGPGATRQLEEPLPAKTSPHHTGWRYVALVFFCFVASFLGAWAYVGTGLVDITAAPTVEEKRTVVAQEGEVVADVVERASPSVVSIVTESIDRSSLFYGSQSSAGTGVVISEDGYILTNKHVVGTNASNVSVIMADGTVHDNVRIVGRDPVNDLAFLKVDGVNNLTAAELGDSADLAVGEQVIAIGNALGQYQTTVTTGIISAIGRPLAAAGGAGGDVEQLENLLQTDAAINPGNSGGPLLTLDGKVIGINTAIAADAEGIGFAIPINDAKGLIKGVLENGEVKRAYLGVRYITISPAVQDEYGVKAEKGAYIPDDGRTNVMAGSPAAKAGLRPGDIITKVGGKEVSRTQPLASLMSTYAVGDKVEITYLRGNDAHTTTVTLEQFPS